MPPAGLPLYSDDDWQHQLRDVISSRDELLAALGLDTDEVDAAGGACADFPLKVPRGFVRRMQRGEPRDPLLLQVLSQAREMLPTPGYTHDPVGERDAAARPGIVHKYHGRVLLIVSGACAVHCRYCFRRHFPYDEHRNGRLQWREALRYVAGDSSIEEVILSGGDPLVATDALLHQLVSEIAAIGHVRRLRIHSRLPVVIPRRVTTALLDAITRPTLQTVMVIHCNHANEIDDDVTEAIASLRRRDITTLNQAVLLADVNDTLDAQLSLSRQLFAAGALPYYLHLLDKVQGAAHFDVPQARAEALLWALAARLPGYMVPKLVREIAGADAKVPVQHVTDNAD